MLLGVIPMFCFGILRIFGEKSQNNKNWKSRHFGPLRQNLVGKWSEMVGNYRPKCDQKRPKFLISLLGKWSPNGL